MEEVKRSSPQAWVLVAHPKTLIGTITPVMINTTLAVMDGRFHWLPTLICYLFISLMQIAANFINDFFDFLRGTGWEDRLGPEHACTQGWISPQAMKTGITIAVALAYSIGCTLFSFAGWELIIVGVLCMLFALLYTAGPYLFSYNSWDDVLVIVFFDFVPVGGTYYIRALTWTPDVITASLICGLPVDTLLVVNNYHDREAGACGGERTVITHFGEKFGRYFYLMLGIITSLLCLCFLRGGHFYAALLPQFYLIPHFLTQKRTVKMYSGRKPNSILDKTSRNMLLMGILIAIGILVN